MGKKVSIIIPVYKVEQYIDQCLESICNQTYKNLEVIIIYDESPDRSLSKCEEWVAKDDRIHLIINEQRKGLGAARNIGLRNASGKYLVYVDSDDWIENNYIEILYNAIEKTHADYVSSVGYYEVNTEKKINICKALPPGEYVNDSEKMLVLLKEIPAVWKKIYNREWLIRKELFQPELFHYEDWGFDIALVLKAEKIVLIPEIGVYYRNEREGCLSNDNLEALHHDFRKSIEFGLKRIDQGAYLERFRIVIQKYLIHDYYIRSYQAGIAHNESALRILEQIKIDILEKILGYRGKNEKDRTICFGSFSLRWIVQNTSIFAQNLKYYGFSSIISAMTPCKKLNVQNESKFRVCQVIQDVTGDFGKTLDLIEERTVLFMDFLEERNSILEYGDDQYITLSEAYASSDSDMDFRSDLIRSGEDRFLLLWQRKCRSLIEKIYEKRTLLSIVLIKNRMSLQYGDLNSKKAFMKTQELKQINNMIAMLEKYFLKYCECKGVSVKVFGLPEQYIFTEEEFRYGCEPQYMNEALYAYLGFQIFRDLCV